MNLYATISAGISALSGPLHGGANQEVIEMLKLIQADGNVRKFIDMAKDRNNPFRLMGFGHRVYKTYDPRAAIIKKECHAYLEKTNYSDPLLDVARQVEEVALTDPYFIERNLYPNVDFYTGILYRALGHPREHVHGDVRPRPPAGLGRALEGDDRRNDENRAAAPGLYRQDPGGDRRSPGRRELLN